MLHSSFWHRSLVCAIALCALFNTGCQVSQSAEETPGLNAGARDTAAIAAPNQSNSETVASKLPLSSQPDSVTPVPQASAPQASAPETPAFQASAIQASAIQAPASIALTPAPTAGDPGTSSGDRVGPEVGTLTQLEVADSCHVTVAGLDGQIYHPGAAFKVCVDYYQYLGQVVQFTYEQVASPTCLDGSDRCPGAIADGPTRQETVITHIEPVEPAEPVTTPDDSLAAGQKTITYYEGRGWDIMVAAFEPWSGEQNAGNFTLKAMELDFSEGVTVADTVDLGNGKITCNAMACSTIWQDGNVRYVLVEETRLEDRFRNGPTDTAGFMIFVGDRQVNQTVELQQERYPNP